jgi:hypothetical protein
MLFNSKNLQKLAVSLSGFFSSCQRNYKATANSAWHQPDWKSLDIVFPAGVNFVHYRNFYPLKRVKT